MFTTVENASFRALALFVVLASTAVEAQKSAVLGIDLGSEFFKVAVVKTGGFDIVFNENSKRKTANAISVINKERSFGDTAMQQKTKKSANVMVGMNQLIGKHFDAKAHEQGEFGQYHLPFKFKKDEKRGTVIYSDVDGEDWSPDEIMGMIFHQIKDMSAKHIEQSVSECVVTVPYYLTEHERRIIIDAAAMVDLSVIMLVNDNTAVAIRYGIETKDSAVKNNVLFVDVGATHTTATVASYFSRAVSDYKNVSSVEIVGLGHSLVGGNHLDAAMCSHFADEFDKKNNKKIREAPKAIAKLRASTEKIKKVLSANKETMLIVEQLHDDIDFKSKINREEFEKICDPIFTMMEVPIREAIKRSGLNMDEIHQVIPFGAGTRVPKVQEMVLKLTEREKWQPSINTDEAAALGAAFVAANFSKSFRLREYHVYDYFPYSIGIDMNGKNATLFKPGSVMEAKKTISQPLSDEVKAADTMTVRLHYNDASLLPPGTPTGLASYTIQGMAEAIRDHNVTGTPKISVAVGMHRDAIIDVLHAELKVHSMDLINRTRFVKKNVTEEIEVKIKTNETETNASDNKSVTNGSDNATDNATAEVANTTENATNGTEEKSEGLFSSLFGSSAKEVEVDTNTDNETTIRKGYELQNVTREKTVEVWEMKLEKKLHTHSLNLTRKHEGLPALSDEAFKAARGRHDKMVEVEAERVARADAKNAVEAYVFTAREKMNAEGFDTVTVEAERENMTASLQTAEDWLWEDGDDVEVKVYTAKVDDLKALVAQPFYRLNQIASREEAIKHFKATIVDAKKRVVDWDKREAGRIEKNETTWVHLNETKKVTKLADEAEVWLKEETDKLEKAGLLVKPPTSSTEFIQYIKGLSNEVHRLRYKAKPKPKYKKKAANASNASNGTNETNKTSTNESKAEEKAEGKEEKKEEKKAEEGKEEKKEEAKEEKKAEAKEETKEEAKEKKEEKAKNSAPDEL